MLAERVLLSPFSQRSLRAARLGVGALLLALLVAACGMPALLAGHFETPEVTLADSKVEAISPSAADVVFGLDIYNPNAYGLRLRSLRYRLRIAGASLAEGETREGLALPGRGVATVRIPVTLDLEALRAAAQPALMAGEIPYQLEAWLRIGTLLVDREVQFSDSSALRLNLPLGLASVDALRLSKRPGRRYSRHT